MEIPHVTNYIAGKLADLMFGDEYLKNNRLSLPDVRRRIDRVLYGEAALGYPWSLYNFVDSKVHEFYKASFRRNFTVEITCRRTEDRLMRWRERTTYLYVRNTEDGDPPVVRLFHDSFFTDSLATAESMEDKRNVFNRFVLNLELRVGDRHFKCRPGDRTKLVQVTPQHDADIEQGICPLQWDVNTYRVSYDAEYRIPAELFSHEAKELRVEILEEFLEPMRDDVYYLGMVGPTEDFSLVCDFPDDVRLELLRFSMHNPGSESPIGGTPSHGHGMITIDGWLLPGHGGCVAWYGMGVKHLENPRAEQVETPAEP